ncbi:hypothetical protein SUGI_1168340 [Cryptomeria japonica]|nr:hypothetical protein SUGI_1168340 [Cryptomeria japonica]
MSGDNLPSPEEAVVLMQNNNFGKLRIYDAQPETVKAYANSGIEIIVCRTFPPTRKRQITLGFTNIPIVVTGSGWPSYGTGENAYVATMENALTYNNNLIKHVLSNAGTSERPGKSMEVFIFALFKENLKTGDETERHFGLFYPNKMFVHSVNFYS